MSKSNQQNETNGGFKLLAIRPIVVKNQKILKTLQEKEVYRFYQDYIFLNNERKEIKPGERVEFIDYVPSTPNNLYNEGNVSINVSAVVGMNGSGKSSLIELLFAGIYNLAVKLEILTSVENDDYIDEKLLPLPDFEMEVFYAINESIFCVEIDNGSIPIFRIVQYESKEDYRHFQITQVLENGKENLKAFFFYTIAINYSIHGLNSKQMGIWVKSLFHKNDGYQTPLVVNPYRKQGNFDINIETYLAKQRLLSNILRPVGKNQTSHLKITDSQRVESITFSLNRSKIKYAYRTGENSGLDFATFFEAEDRAVVLAKIFKAFWENNPIESVSKYSKEVENYVIKKVIQIARTYPEYRGHFRDNLMEHYGEHGGTQNHSIKHSNYFIELDEYLNDLKLDRSHLTFKLRQALNYLRYDTLKEDEEITWKIQEDEDGNEIEELNISVNKLSQRINDVAESQLKLIEFIPPSIFDIKIDLLTDNDVKSFFSELSSGEQQLVQSVQSIIYHAINVNSVFSGLKNNPNKVTYNYLNIILDEVELYFHPEYQRNFVKELVNAIKRMKLNKIKHFNILFSTHSPFILSDIPLSNILHLKDGQAQLRNEQTFGANVHDLLANDFFLKHGFMGQFAQEKINEIVDSLKIYKILNDAKKQGIILLTERDRLNYLKDFNNIPKIKMKTKEECQQLISIVGEPLLYMSLMELYAEAFKEESNAFIDEQITKLTNLRKS